jgi:glycosyltransferase involved in cell wall biosynthesis
MRIHWFSPLAPARTDIAHYTGRILPALSARAEVTLWTDQQHWYSGLERHAAVRRFDPRNFRWEALEDADAAFYNIGNNARFHRAIGMVSRRFPGFSIMHDAMLHESFTFDYRERGDRAGYLGVMQSLYGARGRRDGELFWKGVLSPAQMARVYSCAPFFLGSSLAAASLGAIVHSRAAERALAKEADVPVIRLPLPFGSRGRPRQPSEAPPWKLVVFGYLGANRCLEQILTALARLADYPFQLHIYGEIHDRAGMAALLQSLPLAGRVTIHGFVPEVELDRALGSAHLALNLRYPTKGEASGSQLRIWSHGLPSLVTRVGWYAELPAGTVSFVRPESLVEDLCTHLRAYAARPAGYVEAGLRGYEYFVERHSPVLYAAKIVELAGQAAAYRQRWNALRISGRAVAGLQGWFPVGKLAGYVDHLAEVVGELG